MTTPIDHEEDNTPLPTNVIPIHREFIVDTSSRLTNSEQRLYNIEDSLNHLINVKLPVMDRKLDRILDAQRETNKHIMSIVQPKRNMGIVWSTIGLAYLLISYLLFR